MYHSGPLPLIFKGTEQGFGGKNCQSLSQGKPCSTSTILQYPMTLQVDSKGPADTQAELGHCCPHMPQRHIFIFTALRFPGMYLHK